MIIKDINFYIFEPRFKQMIQTPKVTMTHRKILIIGLVDNTGKEWFGESNVFDSDWYYEETIDSVKRDILNWFTQTKGQPLHSFDQLVESLNLLNEAPAARATVMMALYPNFHTLSYFQIAPIQTINGDFNDRIVQLDHVARLKLKWSSHILEQVQIIRLMYPDMPISIDANQTLSASDVPTLKQLTKAQISYIEEPFHTNELLKKADVLPPIAIDEQATSIQAISQLRKSYPISVVVIKPFRLGGIDRTLELIPQLQKEGVKIVIGGMYEAALSRYYTAWLSQQGDYAGDVTPHGYYFDVDLCATSGQLRDGQLYFQPPTVDRRCLKPF